MSQMLEYVGIVVFFALFISLLLLSIMMLSKGDFRIKFFGVDPTKRTPAEMVRYFTILLGSLLVLATIYTTVKSNELVSESNSLMRQANLNTRFKDAALLLGDDNPSVNIAGIYALSQIAEEERKERNSIRYPNIIFDVFQSYLEVNSEVVRDEKGNIIDGRNSKQPIVVDAILRFIFSYDFKYKLSNCVLKNDADYDIEYNFTISNSYIEYTGLHFQSGAIFFDVYVKNNHLYFNDNTTCAFFHSVLNSVSINNSYELVFDNVKINNSSLNNVEKIFIKNSHLENVELFSDIKLFKIDTKTTFSNVKYIDEDKNEYNIDETNISTYFPQVEWVD